jgi:hypothetical protein
MTAAVLQTTENDTGRWRLLFSLEGELVADDIENVQKLALNVLDEHKEEKGSITFDLADADLVCFKHRRFFSLMDHIASMRDQGSTSMELNVVLGEHHREILSGLDKARYPISFRRGVSFGFVRPGPREERKHTGWTQKKNERRCRLVDKEIEGTLSREERVELDGLQQEMIARRREIAPLGLDVLRQLHEKLMQSG